MKLTKEELEAVKLVVDYHIIDGMGIASAEHQKMMKNISEKLAQMVSES